MATGLEDSGPRYLSVTSSDIILSDIRPIKLKVEALRSVNAFLDELLWNILTISRSLSTDRIKTSLLKILPTTLGKEALLEAEVELKAYWERTNPISRLSSTTTEEQFPLQWSFELLRLKCEAYSTLNDSDEDVNAEDRLSERMRDLGYTEPPPAALIAPAALYLTAIIEFVCEHVLSNIGRVVARDSSRTSATTHDLFVALCEDGAIYDTFKSMKVYTHIENLQKSPRRSKSFTRDKQATTSRTSSQHSDLSSTLRESNSAQSRIRISSESGSGAIAVQSPSRGSIDRAKSKLFGHSKAPSDAAIESQSPQRKIESSYADSTSDGVDTEDQILMDEFDELMRSGATMKVSLTPDRLKSMAVYNKEKHRRGVPRVSINKREVVGGYHDEAPPLPLPDPKWAQRIPNLKHVDSIIEDEEDIRITESIGMSLPATPQSHKFPIPPMVDANSRLRSLSTSQLSSPPKLPHKSSWSSSTSVTRSLVAQKSDLLGPKNSEVSGKLTRSRKPQRNIENMDLDEIMNGSDEDGEESAPPPSYKAPTKAAGPVVSVTSKMSATTQELINFLAEGPPEEPQPIVPATQSISKTKPGRLGRMMSRLTRGPSAERLREETSTAPRTAYFVLPSSPRGPTFSPNVQSVRNLPGVIVGTPPRPPPAVQPIMPASPPISPSDEKTDVEELQSPVASTARQPAPVSKLAKLDPTRLAPPPSPSRQLNRTTSTTTGPAGTNGSVNGDVMCQEFSQSSRMNADVVAEPGTGAGRLVSLLTTSRVHELRHLLANATNADECRLLVDMFLARVGFPVDRVGADPPYPSPNSNSGDTEMENSLVEVLLGGTPRPIPAFPDSTGSETSQPQNNRDNLLHVIPPRSESLIQDTRFLLHPARKLAVV